jgi:D-3-phosphoglycerate dehydrogenase
MADLNNPLRALLLEGINDSAVDLMQAHGFEVTRLPGAMDSAALAEALAAGPNLLGIRSRSQLDAAALAAAGDALLSVGCFSVGTDQVDLDATRARGIPVFNAPFSNTRSVAELVIGEIVMLMRQIFPRSNAAHAGDWAKSATGSHEVRGKTLGIVGYGNIGTQLSTLAEAMGMRVIYHDRTDKLRHGNSEPAGSLQALLGAADIVSLHVPDTPETAGMIDATAIAAMKPGAYLINNSRGSVVDLHALAAALRSGHLAGAAIDVFPKEPKSNKDRFETPLQGIENVLLTPHVGGSTEEAQERIGAEVARKLVEHALAAATEGAVNFPQVTPSPARPGAIRFAHVHRNVPGVLGGVNAALSAAGLNVVAQSLQTDGDTGYVIVDAEGCIAGAAAAVLSALLAVPGTVRARMIGDGTTA